MKTLLVLLTDPLERFYRKGEIKPRYYNPENVFDEVHFFSPAEQDLEPAAVREIVGTARMTIHSFGPSYGVAGWLPGSRPSRAVEAIRPDVIRAYDPGLRGALAVWWARRLGIPSLVSVHADPDDQRRHEGRVVHRLRLPVERYAMRRAHAVICVSRYVEGYARRRGASRVEVIYNHVDVGRFASGNTGLAGRRVGPAAVLTVGRLVPQKDPACLIRAMEQVDAQLTLIGDGPLRPQLDALVRRLDLHGRVKFLQAVPHAQIHSYYHNADLFAIATHYEGFCIPVLEAMAAGLPVVASRIGPIEELVGEAGLLVENTPEAFAGALNRLIQDPDLRAELSERARARARELDGHGWEAREAALYREVVDGPPSEPRRAFEWAGSRDEVDRQAAV